MNRLFPILAFLAAACVAPSAAFAQVAADTGTIFVAAAGFADMRRAPTSEVLNGPDDDASGTVAGGALTLGVHLTPRLSVRAEWSLSDTLSLDRNYPFYPYAVEDLVTRGLGGLSPSGLPPTSLLVPQQTTEQRDVKAGFALLGYHLGAGRASVELLAGLGLVNEQVTTITEILLPGIPRVPNYRSDVLDLRAPRRGRRRRRRRRVADNPRRAGAAGAGVRGQRRAAGAARPGAALDVLAGPDVRVMLDG